MQRELPKIKPKKINIKRFVKLAKRVRQIVAEEDAWLQKHQIKNGNHNSSGVFYND